MSEGLGQACCTLCCACAWVCCCQACNAYFITYRGLFAAREGGEPTVPRRRQPEKEAAAEAEEPGSNNKKKKVMRRRTGRLAIGQFGSSIEVCRSDTSNPNDAAAQLALLLEDPLATAAVETVDLGGCALTDAAMLALALRCPRLTALNLDSTSGLTAAAIEAVIRACPDLQHVDVSHTTGLSIIIIIIEALSRCPNLRTLKARDCGLETLGDADVDNLAQLDHLDLSGNDALILRGGLPEALRTSATCVYETTPAVAVDESDAPLAVAVVAHQPERPHVINAVAF